MENARERREENKVVDQLSLLSLSLSGDGEAKVKRRKKNETLNFVERDSRRRIFVIQVKRAISERNDKIE